MTLWILLITTPCLPLRTLASAFITDHLRCRHQPRGKMSEQQIQQEIRIACSNGDTRLWRNNTGTLKDQHGRPVQFGLCKGSADLIGYRTITITPDMVGQQVAVFTSIEVKTPTGRLRPEQRAWLETVHAAGGIAGVARSVEDALRIVTAQG
jgi:hypothetical protein